MHAKKTPDRCERYRWSLLLLSLLGLLMFNSAQAQRVAVISDLNPGYGKTEYSDNVDRAISRIIALKPELVISTGDMVAGQRPRKLLNRTELEAMWKAFHRHVSEPLAAAGIPLAITPGNHDASVYAAFALERSVYSEQWNARRPELTMIDAQHYPLYYAFALDDLLFLSLDVTRPGALSAAQMNWLQRLLTEHGAQYRYRTAFSHLPLWAFAQRRESDIIADPALESLLRQHDVDMYLSGHHHAWYPGYKDDIAYIGQSCLGGGTRQLIGTRQRARRSFTLIDYGPRQASVSAFAAPDFTTAIDLDDLPTNIRSREATLLRLDRAPTGATRIIHDPQ